MTEEFDKLVRLLEELFQLDQPDLDFGFYRIMHAKSAEVSQFLRQDLLPQVKAAFSQYRPADKAAIERELTDLRAGIEKAGMDPAQSPRMQELERRLADDSVDLGALEAEVYDHLYSFFRRYYSEGDFLSHRVYKPGVYAIPYEGEEVKLHWANADQYYIKTTDYLRDYAFRLRPHDDERPMRVHFRLLDAAEGEHGNVKETAGKERRFRLATESPIGLEEGELVIRFTYQPDPAKQKELNTDTEEAVLSRSGDPELVEWLHELDRRHVRTDGTESEATRLRVHLDRYTARNTFDYFIHKDLGDFLRRELDFYIKNEVMHLDDMENEDAPRAEQYLSKIKVIRRIAGKVIEFLAQLEDFQKKLWLKKKFVVETSWCIRMDCIPEEFYPEIAANEVQREEWVKLLAIDEIDGDLTSPGYSTPLTPAFLKANPTLMLDSRQFSPSFAERMLEAIGDINEQSDGVVVAGENFQALSLLLPSLRKQVDCIYIDPPYNTGSDGFAYKDSYQHSSWQAMMDDRLALGRAVLSESGVVLSSIDDVERSHLDLLLASQFGRNNLIGCIVWKGATDNNPTRIASEHEYIICFARDKGHVDQHWSAATSDAKQSMLDAFERISAATDVLEEIESRFARFMAEHREELGDLYRYRRVDTKGPYAARRNLENPGKPGYYYDVVHPVTGRACTKPHWGWRFPESTMSRLLSEERIIFGVDETKIPERKVYLRDVRFPLRSVLALDARKGSNDLHSLFAARDVFKNPKPVQLLGYLLSFAAGRQATVLDYFAGSGTTGHSVINLNREDGGRRRFIMVEMGDHFDTALIPRLKKVAFSPEWKDGKPKRLATPEEAERSPRILKFLRLESYEDTLNNLELTRTDDQQSLLALPAAQGAGHFKEQYLLRYMLDVETRGSKSLLNVADFLDPTAYRLKVKRTGSDESREIDVDLFETFNWLIGLTVHHVAAPHTYQATFRRADDPDLPVHAPRRLVLDDRLREHPDGPWWFRTVIGTLPDGRRALVIWRRRPGGEIPEGIERDNLVLEEWFKKQEYSTQDTKFDLIYVNGGNNLGNLKSADETWKVRLIEEDFHRLMFETEGA